ncbi:hypothetical protein CVT24_005171 [Panaeolus cyanescens]|uniref:Uncharacterized protein n=1 Tax=Panaeolus cyanescens TaxID=181874 RepID=A0A409Y9Q8_9AGAR|nr:hypothetical protein CVT24_005171 [Panaeolus cyanescens]
MRAINCVFFFICSLVGVVRAYSIPGGYERVMFYYAYLMDCQLNGGTPKTIAVKCGKTPCTFDAFLRYIMKEPPATIDIFSKPYPAIPPLQETALAVIDNDLAGGVDPSHVHTDAVKNDKYEKLLNKVSDFVGGKYFSDTLPQELRDGGKQAMQRILVARKEAQHTSFFEKAPGSAYTPKYTEPKPSLYGIEYLKIDPKATVAANPGLEYKTFVTEWKAHIDEGHQGNINALSKQLELIDLSCT